ncbi:hypothetical protein AX17_001254 [Amanita inopinata Kibby_2008]|nr:hypothetical protein AX17_001254 [Amanita inopinata Kibby_2008]
MDLAIRTAEDMVIVEWQEGGIEWVRDKPNQTTEDVGARVRSRRGGKRSAHLSANHAGPPGEIESCLTRSRRWSGRGGSENEEEALEDRKKTAAKLRICQDSRFKGPSAQWTHPLLSRYPLSVVCILLFPTPSPYISSFPSAPFSSPQPMRVFPMRSSWCAVGPLLLTALSVLYSAHPTTASPALTRHSPSIDLLARATEQFRIARRDGDHGHHNHHATPLVELNETEVLMHHAPTPPSYYTIDWEEHEPSTARHPGLIMAHALFMSLAFFGALPIGIAMRSVKHPAHGLAIFSFYGLCALGCATSALYSKLTPNMYEGAKHAPHGWLVLCLAVFLTVIDVFAGLRRCIAYFRSEEKLHLKTFWQAVVLNKDVDAKAVEAEYTNLVVQEPEEYETHETSRFNDRAQWSIDVPRHNRQSSTASDGTIFDSHSPNKSEDVIHPIKTRNHPHSKASLLARVGNLAFSVTERILVFAGLLQLLTGIAIYTGGCRENYVNGCLAHLIKGGIFWCYGLASFARFLGSFAEYGWAWNKAPFGNPYSAEFVESLVIFTYGATNTWMERFGARPGDPFTTKQIQHISIAVMFCFAGLVGMGIESKRIRKWLASSTFASSKSPKVSKDATDEPPSYSASFNPFPALVIGVTGAAMSAHFQMYLFQVQIHALWGNLLVAFAVLRCFTYFFLWLGPPRSILPSRPPTEALGSFFLACGGLVFMFSTEEVTVAAMRRGRDDVMMFLNVAVAITCFAFCWTLCVVAFKGWLKMRARPSVAYLA